MDGRSRAGTAYPSAAPVFIPSCLWGSYWMVAVEQEQLTRPEHLCSFLVVCGVLVVQSFLCLCGVLSIIVCSFVLYHFICSTTIYHFLNYPFSMFELDYNCRKLLIQDNEKREINQVVT